MVKKFFLAVILLLLATAVRGLAEEFLADPVLEPADFMGVKWGQDVNTLEGFTETYRSEEGDMVILSRSGDVKQFGSASLDSIEYTFIRDKLTRGSLVAKGDDDEAALLKEALDTYGRETARVGGDYMWRFTDVNVMYSAEPDFEQSVLFYIYLPRN